VRASTSPAVSLSFFALLAEKKCVNATIGTFLSLRHQHFAWQRPALEMGFVFTHISLSFSGNNQLLPVSGPHGQLTGGEVSVVDGRALAFVPLSSMGPP
jgi:hypothetical protein